MILLSNLIANLTKTEHGFKHIVEAGDMLLANHELNHFDVARHLIRHETYQARMLGTYLLGRLSGMDSSALHILKHEVAADPNWRVQEMLAKAFDQYAKDVGYQNSLEIIEYWLADSNPNVVRAVIEGLRIWTGRPYFKENPEVAVSWISAHKADESEYVRKSVGNALRDITRKHAGLVKNELLSWDLSDKRCAFTYKLIMKNE